MTLNEMIDICRSTRGVLVLVTLLLWSNATRLRADEMTKPYDIVVYGGTAAAVTAAVQARRMGHSVIIISPDQHLGGLTSGGLGWTDTGNPAVIGGLAKEFYQEVFRHYQNEGAWRQQTRANYGKRALGYQANPSDAATMWVFEPHVAEMILERWVDENSLEVVRNQWLDRESGVRSVGGVIESISMLSGETYSGRVFIDATYEGDLIAASGIQTTIGRESTSEFDEPHAGVQPDLDHHHHHFQVLQGPVDPYVIPGDPDSGLLPLISPNPVGAAGSGDRRIQAYCFRMCLTDASDNRVPFAKPDGYDPNMYELLIRCFEQGWRNVFNKFDPLPNRKTDTNNHGPVSFDYLGANYDYPEASYARRREIIGQHEIYQKGLLYFIATDPRVPRDIQAEMNRWGLAKDEFVDNGHWPHQLYVREARRMIGDFIMTENHLRKTLPTSQSIGMGSYAIDSHNTQRYVDDDGHVQNEGDVGVSTNGPYEIAMGAVLPQRAQCTNLVSPVCVSSTHMAFGSIRMEPVFMILGQSAASIASLAIDADTAVQDVPYALVRERLLQDGQVLQTPPGTRIRSKSISRGVSPSMLPGNTIDDNQATRTGNWTTSRSTSPFIGSGYRHDQRRADGKATATFAAALPHSGLYEVRVASPPNINRSTRTKIQVTHADGTSIQSVDQTKSIDHANDATWPISFKRIGTFRFTPDSPAEVMVSNEGADGYVIIDAVNFLAVP
ncbi:MAG: FAD-dependent oxidoreductase [Planctomycetota bacterium]